MTKTDMQTVIAALLEKHYSLSIGDTPFTDVDAFNSRFEPYELVNWWAEECDLDRTDIRGAWGTPCNKPLTIEDQENAIRLTA